MIHVANKLADPLVFVEMGTHGYVRVLKQGDVAICWIWELSSPERSIIPLTDPGRANAGPECFDISGIQADTYVERSSSFDVSQRREIGQQAMLAELDTDRPVVLLYLDDNGAFFVLQDGEVDVRLAEAISSLGTITVWCVERYVIRDLSPASAPGSTRSTHLVQTAKASSVRAASKLAKLRPDTHWISGLSF
jgi:hypothetical protein